MNRIIMHHHQSNNFDWTSIGVIVALFGIVAMVCLWLKDRYDENKFHKKIKLLFIEELQTNLRIAEYFLREIDNYNEKKSLTLGQFRFLEEKIFFSIINSQNITKIIPDGSFKYVIENLLELSNTIATFNRNSYQIWRTADQNGLDYMKKWLKEVIDFTNKVLPKIGEKSVKQDIK